MGAGTLACRVTALAGYFALLALLLARYTIIAPPERIPVSIVLVVVAVPLLFPLRGLLHGRPYTHAWTSFLALVYFALGVDTVAADVVPLVGWGLVAASLALFGGAVGFARLRGRELRRAAGLAE
jgi:uncharacterized membrane protein